MMTEQQIKNLIKELETDVQYYEQKGLDFNLDNAKQKIYLLNMVLKGE